MWSQILMVLWSVQNAAIASEGDIDNEIDALLWKNLAGKHAVPCVDLKELSLQSDLQSSLQKMVSADVKPASVPIRAATCLLELYPENMELYSEWVSSKQFYGLARLTIGHLSHFAEAEQVLLVKHALEGENALQLRRSIEKLNIPHVQEQLRLHPVQVEEGAK